MDQKVQDHNKAAGNLHEFLYWLKNLFWKIIQLIPYHYKYHPRLLLQCPLLNQGSGLRHSFLNLIQIHIYKPLTRDTTGFVPWIYYIQIRQRLLLMMATDELWWLGWHFPPNIWLDSKWDYECIASHRVQRYMFLSVRYSSHKASLKCKSLPLLASANNMSHLL
jgi:hypothetical protein